MKTECSGIGMGSNGSGQTGKFHHYHSFKKHNVPNKHMRFMKNLACVITSVLLVGCCSKAQNEKGYAYAALGSPQLVDGCGAGAGINSVRVDQTKLVAGKANEMEAIVGNTIDVLIAEHGLPDSIESAKDYSVLFQSGAASVVLTYASLRKRVYVTRDCRILGVVPVDAVEK